MGKGGRMSNTGKFIKRRIFFFAFFMGLFGQGYWQQSLHYKMAITLDPDAARVDGHEEIVYANNSPDTLREIYLNLYPRAFRKGSVKDQEFKRQLGALGRTRTFLEGKEDVYHDYELIHVEVRQGDISGNTYKIDDTILSISLPRSLAPLDTVVLVIDWTHINGEMFERAGKIGDHFNMAQWYPKPMVYDEQGWNINPFHAEGEFYGEFATFDVSFDIPEDYVLAATGIVTEGDPGWQTVTFDTSQVFSEWVARYDSLKAAQDSDKRRTVTFHAENVHDFAWVAARDFIYEHGTVDGIDVHVFYSQKNGTKWNTVVLERAVRAMEWLNSRFGSYPYPQVSVTDRLRGGGMEYPMLVMNGSDREGLIVHEIGHIWFYGILANNEIDEAWLDEGFTSFQTRWFNAYHYPPYGYDISQYKLSPFARKYRRQVSDLHRSQWNAIRFQLSGLDEPVSRSSYLYDNGQAYRANVYTKASLMLHELQYVLGESLFSAAMQHYFDTWQLKHVNENRFIKALEETTQQELEWFFNPWLHDTQVLDYALDSWHTRQTAKGWETFVTVARKGQRSLPVTVQVRYGEGLTLSQRIPDFKWNYSHNLVFQTPDKPQRIVIDPDSRSMDIDFRNNYNSAMPREWILDWANRNYTPRTHYVMKWFPRLDYHPVDGLLPGISLEQSYAFWEKTKVALQFGTESSRIYGFLDMQREFKWSQPGTNYYLNALRYNGFAMAQIRVSHRFPRSYYLPQVTFGGGVAMSEGSDNVAAPLIDEGRVVKTFLYYQFSSRSLTWFTRFETAATDWSDWSFNKWYSRLNYTLSKNKTSLRVKGFMGRYWSADDLPRQEQFNIAGANAQDRYAYPYTRHPDSFYGISDFSNHIYVPGDGGIRGLTGQAAVLSSQIISVNVDMSYTIVRTPVKITGAIFAGVGTIWSDHYGLADGDAAGAGGLSVILEKSVWERPLYLRIDVPAWTVWSRTVSGEDQSYTYLISFSRSI